MEKKRFTRKFSEEQRVTFVNKVLESESNILIAKRYDLNPKLLSKWVNNYRHYSQTLEPKNNEIIPNYKKEYNKAIEKIKDQELKIAVLEAVNIAKPTYYAKQHEYIKRSYANVGRRAPGYSYTFSGMKILDLDIQKYIIKIKNYKTSKTYGYRKVTYQLRNQYNLQINKKKGKTSYEDT